MLLFFVGFLVSAGIGDMQDSQFVTDFFFVFFCYVSVITVDALLLLAQTAPPHRASVA